MTVKAYIQDKFQSLGYSISEGDLLELSIDGGLTMDNDFTKDNILAVKMAIVGFLPALLARPRLISEGGFSMSFNPEDIKEYCSLLCREVGIESPFSTKITFM